MLLKKFLEPLGVSQVDAGRPRSPLMVPSITAIDASTRAVIRL